MNINIGEAIGKGFERVLRWIYPGALFVSVMGLSWPDLYIDIVRRPNGWIELIIIGIAGGFAAYLIQSNVFHPIVSWCTQKHDWEINLLPEGEDGPECLKCLAEFFKPYARFIRSRWDYRCESDGFFVYQYASYHATMMTGWLPLISWVSRNWSCSLWDKLPMAWVWLCVLLVVMLAAGLFLYLRLTRIDLRGMPNHPPKDRGKEG